MSTFYTYTSAELQGAGSLISIHLNKLSAKTPYVFQLPSDYSGSVYFALETIRNANQVYDSASPKNFLTPIIFPIYQTVDMVKSDYIASFVLANGDNRFVIYSNTAIDGTKVYLRATGDINLVIEQTALASGTWNTTSNNWESESNLWGV